MAFSSNVLLCFLAIAQATSYVTAFGITPFATQKIELSLVRLKRNDGCALKDILRISVHHSPSQRS